MTDRSITGRWPRWLPAAGVAVLGLAASVSGLRNGFAYDDVPIIVENSTLHDWHHLAHRFLESYWPPSWGAALYRPVVTALFTLEWAAGRGSPLPFHALNILLYAGVCVLVYALARHLLPRDTALLAAALYAVDPLHVEVVANSVGQSELVSALAVCGAMVWYLQRRRQGLVRGRDVVYLSAIYAIGCLTKEHAIVMPALLLVAELTVIVDRRPWRERVRALRLLALSLAMVGVAYLAARMTVIGGLVGENPAIPFRDTSWATRVWTMLGVVPEWVRLLAWPAHLAAIYSPPATAILDRPNLVAVAGALVLIAAAALAVVARRRLPVASFGLVWIGFLLLPVSNVLVLTGVLLAERSLFLPSVGAALTVGALVPVAASRLPAAAAHRRIVVLAAGGLLAVALGAGVWRSASRSVVWHDNDALFQAAVLDEPMSYAAHNGYAAVLFGTGRRGSGEREALTALRIYTGDPAPYVGLATEYARAGRCGPSELLARQALAMAPHSVTARLVLGQCLARTGDYRRLRSVALVGVADGYRRSLFRQMLSTADSGARAAREQRPAGR